MMVLKQMLKPSDIRFWILLLFLIRWIGIQNPPLETGHNWRQSLTNMTTRNLERDDWDFMHPRTDMAGEKSGIFGAEFPLYNLICGLFNTLFGYSHAHGRIISLIFSSLAVWCFYLTLTYFESEQTAFSAAIILSVSIWFSFSRKIMPDVFSVSLMLIAVYWMHKYIRSHNSLLLILAGILASLAMLSKLPSILFMVLLIIPIAHNSISRKQKAYIICIALIAIAMPALWYFRHVPYLVKTYGFELYFPKSLSEGFQEVTLHLPELWEKFYFSALHSWLAFGFFLMGTFVLFKNKEGVPIGVFISFLGVLGLFILKTGAVFPLHNYYIIPFVPVMAWLCAKGLGMLPKKAIIICLVLISAESILNQQHDFFIKDPEWHKMRLEPIAALHTDRHDLWVMSGGPSPQHLYFADRRGWPASAQQYTDQAYMQDKIKKGARFFMLEIKDVNDFIFPWKVVYADKDWRLYDLRASLKVVP
jgi:hypothetical protein